MGNKTAQAQDLASLKDVQESMVSDPAHVTAMLKQMFIAYDKDKSGILYGNNFFKINTALEIIMEKF